MHSKLISFTWLVLCGTVRLMAESLPQPVTGGIIEIEATAEGDTRSVQHNYEPPKAAIVLAETVLRTLYPRTIRTSVAGAAGSVTSSFTFDPSYATNHPQVVKPIRGINHSDYFESSYRYPNITLKTEWDDNGRPSFSLRATHYLTSQLSVIEGPGVGRIFHSDFSPSPWWTTFYSEGLTRVEGNVHPISFGPGYDFHYLPGAHNYWVVLQPDGTNAVFNRGYFTEPVFELGEFYPIGTITTTGTAGHGPSFEDTMEPLIEDDAYTGLQAEDWSFTGKFEATVGPGAHYAFRPDVASASKVRYKIQIQPGLARTITWNETFTPEGAVTPSDYRFLSEEVALDATETQVHTLDPFSWHGAEPGVYSVQAFEAESFGAALTVDANRDGVILPATPPLTDYVIAHADITTAEHPYRFWINDDDDELVDSSQTGLYTESEQDERDNSQTHYVDWVDNWLSLNGTRNLEDFARLWIDISSLGKQIEDQDIRVGLRWSDISSGAPSIKVFPSTDFSQPGSLRYLIDKDAANFQTNAHAFHDATSTDTDHTLIAGTGTFMLANYVFRDDVTHPLGKARLLFEGCSAGKGQLKIILFNKDGVEIGEGPGVWLDLQEPKEFVERWSCGDAPLGAVQPVALVNAKSGTFAPPVTDDEKDYVLYVHGYNMQEFEKQRWLETTYKRLWHLGYKGRVGSFSWPCSDSALPYDQSEERAWQSAVQLRALLSNLKAASYRVHVLGHSQGNVVVGEALRQWKEAGNTDALVRTYVASQAAIQAHCYDSDAALIPDFSGSLLSDDGTPNVYVNYPTTGEPYMTAAAMSGVATRFLNFENPRDYALTGNSISVLDFHPGWQANQRLKPDVGFTYDSVGGFRESTGVGLSIPLYLPADRFRIFSYCAEGRSLALGSTPTGGVFANTNIDLSLDPFSYGREHLFHSGQFRSSMAERYQYWIALLDAALIPHLNP